MIAMFVVAEQVSTGAFLGHFSENLRDFCLACFADVATVPQHKPEFAVSPGSSEAPRPLEE